MGDLYREQALTALFQALDVDHHGSIAGDKLIDSIQLLDLDEESEQLRTAAAHISAVLREDMTCDQFLEVRQNATAPHRFSQRSRVASSRSSTFPARSVL